MLEEVEATEDEAEDEQMMRVALLRYCAAAALLIDVVLVLFAVVAPDTLQNPFALG